MTRTGFVLSCIVVAAGAMVAARAFAAEADVHASAARQLDMEHRITAKIADAARAQAAAVRDGSVDREKISRIVDFFANFTDRCHHAKEERHYFPAVLNNAPRAAPLVDELMMDHDEGKRHLRAVRDLLARDALDQWDRRELAWRLDEYAHLIVGHIEREDRLYAIADPAFTDAQRDRLAAAFTAIETDELGEDFHQRYHAMAMQILGKTDGPSEH